MSRHSRATSSTRSSRPSSASAIRSSSFCSGSSPTGVLPRTTGPREDARRALLRPGPQHALLADPVHARSHALGRDRLVDLEPARRRLRVPARADLHQPPPRGRDQPRSAEDPGGAPRGDAGAPGDDRGRDTPLRAAVSRDRDAEPDRVRGHVPASWAQLDRFLLRTAFGYPSREGEVDVLARRIDRESDDVELRAVVDRETLLAMQGAVERVHVAGSVREYCVDLVVATRAAPSCAVGASPRGSLALLKCTLSSRAPRARLRPARRRQGRRRARPRPPAGAPPGAVGAARLGRGRRSRGARHGPDTTR